MNLLSLFDTDRDEAITNLESQGVISKLVADAARANNLVDLALSKDLSDTDKLGITNIMSDDERFDYMQRKYNPERDPKKALDFLGSHEVVPYFLDNLDAYILDSDYEKTVVEVWRRGEAGQFSPDAWEEAFEVGDVDSFTAAGHKIPKRYIKDDGTITIYRGGNEGYSHAHSWTLSRKMAHRFAWMQWRQFDQYGNYLGYYLNPKPTVYKAIIPIDAVLWYDNGRKEYEVVIDTLYIPTEPEVIEQSIRQVSA